MGSVHNTQQFELSTATVFRQFLKPKLNVQRLFGFI